MTAASIRRCCVISQHPLPQTGKHGGKDFPLPYFSFQLLYCLSAPLQSKILQNNGLFSPSLISLRVFPPEAPSGRFSPLLTLPRSALFLNCQAAFDRIGCRLLSERISFPWFPEQPGLPCTPLPEYNLYCSSTPFMSSGFIPSSPNP